LLGSSSARADEFHEGNLPLKIECSHRAIVASGGFKPNTLSVESLGLRSGVPHLVRGSHRTALSRVYQRSSDTFASRSPIIGREVMGMMRGEDISWQFSRTRALGIGI